jgi:integrase
MDTTGRIRVGDRVAVYPRGKKKTYVADYHGDGGHRRVSLKTTNRKTAVERATLLAADVVAGVHRRPPPPLELEAAIEQYLAVLATDGRAPRTLGKYRTQLTNFRRFLAGRRVTKLHEVGAADFDAWRAARRAVVGAVTCHDEGVVAKQLFKYARIRKLVAEDPLAAVKLPEPPPAPKPAPSLEQLEAILAAADGELRTWLLVLALTGLRVGELARLRAQDVDFAGNWIRVASRPGAETKNRTGRKVPMHPRLRRALEGLPARDGGWYFGGGPGPAPPRRRAPDRRVVGEQAAGRGPGAPRPAGGAGVGLRGALAAALLRDVRGPRPRPPARGRHVAGAPFGPVHGVGLLRPAGRGVAGLHGRDPLRRRRRRRRPAPGLAGDLIDHGLRGRRPPERRPFGGVHANGGRAPPGRRRDASANDGGLDGPDGLGDARGGADRCGGPGRNRDERPAKPQLDGATP